MSELALKLIRECKETRSTRLDLGNCGLTELPDELFELVWLEELILSSTITRHKISIDSGNDKHKSLNSGGKNNIKKLAPDISVLEKLKILHINGNTDNMQLLTDLSPLQENYNLEELYLNFTSITDLSPLNKLNKLKVLSLQSTEIKNLIGIENLISLIYLNISYLDIVILL